MKLSKLMVIVGATLSPLATAAGWVDNWVTQNGTVSPPSSYQGGNRSYLSAGNLSVRVNSTSDHPITVSVPRIETSGCGVDIFGGGLSYMDADYLVEKFESIIQNGEAVAFQLGVSALSDKLSTIVGEMEEITNFLNGLQLDDCAIAKSAITTVIDKNGFTGKGLGDAGNAVLQEVTQKQSLNLGIFKNATDNKETVAANDGKPDGSANVKRSIDACPDAVKDLYTAGSFIRNVTDQYGMSGYESLIRGYLGDVVIQYVGDAEVPVAIAKTSCKQNDNSGIEDFTYGIIHEASFPTTLIANNYSQELQCTASSSDGLIEYVDEMLNDIADELEDPDGDLTADPALLRFANNSPVPVLPLLEMGIGNGKRNQIIDSLRLTVAYSYSYYIIRDLHRNIELMLHKAEGAIAAKSVDETEFTNETAASPTEPTPECNLKPFIGVNDQLVKIKDRAKDISSQAATYYQAMLQQTMLLNSTIDRIANTKEGNQ